MQTLRTVPIRGKLLYTPMLKVAASREADEENTKPSHLHVLVIRKDA